MPQAGVYPEVRCERFIYDTEASHATTSIVFVTALDITGRGQAQIFKLKFAGAINHWLRITVDGVIVINNRILTTHATIGAFYGIYNFNSSFKVEHGNSDNVTEVALVISYCVN